MTHFPHSECLPMSKEEMHSLGWDQLDIILVTGDAYIDHPSFGSAMIARVLAAEGYKVGIIAQPDWRTPCDFMQLGRPRLFFGVTSGNVDSMIANYTALKKPRRFDDFSPKGKPGLRPDRACIVYTNKIKEAYKDIPVVLGGLEASLRRLAHYDYWDNAIRRSLLVDAKADILVYGMGETQILEVAARILRKESLDAIRGTVIARSQIPEVHKESSLLPAFDEIHCNKKKFNEAFRIIYTQMNPFNARALIQPHGHTLVIQNPPALPVDTQTLDSWYALPFTRLPHPRYKHHGPLKAQETIQFSLTAHRGCAGECSFCGLFMHQGRIIQSRSLESVEQEARLIASQEHFNGTITDVGGPSANLYQAHCTHWQTKGFCAHKKCLFPSVCSNLKFGYAQSIALYRRLSKIPKIKHVFIGSGFRHDLLIHPSAHSYLEYVCRHHISGQMKVAPEHVASQVLSLMHKPPFRTYQQFLKILEAINKKLKKRVYLANYFISAPPGSTHKEASQLANFFSQAHMHPEQIQDFTPIPMTLAGCIYYTGVHPFTNIQVYVPRTHEERIQQRTLIQPTFHHKKR